MCKYRSKKKIRMEILVLKSKDIWIYIVWMLVYFHEVNWVGFGESFCKIML
jgi:hypothetical protein